MFALIVESNRTGPMPIRATNPDDPNRCEHFGPTGQCPLLRATNTQGEYVDGVIYCECHGGAKQLTSVNRETVRNYRLTIFKAQVARFADSSQIKSLREEIGIARMILEERLNQCQDALELLSHSSEISSLIGQINSVVTNCHKIEAGTGQLLDRTEVLNLVTQLVGIITEETLSLPLDEATRGAYLDRVSTRSVKALTQATHEQD